MNREIIGFLVIILLSDNILSYFSYKGPKWITGAITYHTWIKMTLQNKLFTMLYTKNCLLLRTRDKAYVLVSENLCYQLMYVYVKDGIWSVFIFTLFHKCRSIQTLLWINEKIFRSNNSNIKSEIFSEILFHVCGEKFIVVHTNIKECPHCQK